MRACESATAGTAMSSPRKEKTSARRSGEKRDERSAISDISGPRNFLSILDHDFHLVVARLFGGRGSNRLSGTAENGFGMLLGDVQDGAIGGQALQYGSDHLHLLQMPVLGHVVHIPEIFIERQLVETAVKFQLAAKFDGGRNALKHRRK